MKGTNNQKTYFVLLAILSIAVLAAWPGSAASQALIDGGLYLPVVLKDWSTGRTPPSDDGIGWVNYYRGKAGVPLVNDDPILNENCFQHARYMAENDDLTHDQDPSLPYASPEGQICAGSGNVWLGGDFTQPYWEPVDSVTGWMSSVGHRLWLLYPTTPTFGYGFYTDEDSYRAGAALDVLSTATFNDGTYTGWPVHYPAPGQTGVPAERYPITLNWPYFGPPPVLDLNNTSLVANGQPLAFAADTALPAGHKGVQMIPAGSLPAGATITVHVAGSYDGQPFDDTWQFSVIP